MLFPELNNKPVSLVSNRSLRLAGVVLLFGLFSCNHQDPDTSHPVLALPEVKDTVQPLHATQKDTSMAVKTPLASPPSSAAAKIEETPGFTVQTVYDSAQLWGYEIYFGKKLLVRQKNIPSLPGTKGFATEEQAQRAGNFVAWKASNNIFPPTVNKQELDSLGVLNNN